MRKAGLFELNAVVAVSLQRSFRRAAAQIGISPSALSHAIGALERRMGVRLFNRTTRSVSLSEAGEKFLARVRPALREISEAIEAANEFRDTPTGTLRINTSEGAAEMMAPCIVEFLSRYPGMNVDIATENRLVDIVAENFDAGIRLAENVSQNMIAVPCTPPLRLVVVGSPAYFVSRAKPRSPADLPAHNCIRLRLSSGKIFKWEFEKRGKEAKIDVSGSLTLDSHHLLLDAAIQGVGLAWTSEFAAAPHIAAGRLVQVLEDWTPPFPGLALFYPGHRHVPAGLRAFIEVIRERTSAQTRKRPPSRG
jgi:DNA-binding transcriptional LysR family regulator